MGIRRQSTYGHSHLDGTERHHRHRTEATQVATCDNSAANQPHGAAPRDLNLGEGTEEEMCLGFLYITE
jgi:hypothetical protein